MQAELEEKDKKLMEKDKQLAEKDDQLAENVILIQAQQDEINRLNDLLAHMQIETQNVTSGPSSSKKRKI